MAKTVLHKANTSGHDDHGWFSSYRWKWHFTRRTRRSSVAAHTSLQPPHEIIFPPGVHHLLVIIFNTEHSRLNNMV